MRKIQGIFGAIYEADVDDKANVSIKCTKKDGKVFYIPIKDIEKIAHTLAQYKQMIESKEKYNELTFE